MKKTIFVVASPYSCDQYLPWIYSGEAFKSWVYEVLLDFGKAGRYPRNVDEAIEIARGAKYVVKEQR